MRPALTELRLKRAAQPLTERWRQLPVQPRGAAQLGISFRPLQAAALGLDPDEALQALLAYPFQVIRLGAYWNRLEPHPGDFQPGELDRQLDAAERAVRDAAADRRRAGLRRPRRWLGARDKRGSKPHLDDHGTGMAQCRGVGKAPLR